MKISFYGAARSVTGSQHLIEVNSKRILLDCGLYQGKRSEAYERNVTFPYDPKTVDLCILSHAHIDHSGNLPNLVKSGFQGDIICTFATRDLCATMLQDSGHIQEKDVQYVNKRRDRDGLPPVEPIYTQLDAAQSLHSFSSYGYGRTRMIAPGVHLTFIDAGHMLGSASVILDIEDHEQHRDMRLVFSGDIGRQGIPIIRDPEYVDRADVVIMESTYGDRHHPPYEDEIRQLKRIVIDTYKRGGHIIIPAFAVGRTQQLVYTLHQLSLQGDIPDMPIYVDSPLAIDVTGIYRLHPECYDEEIRSFIQNQNIRDPWGFNDLHYTRTTEESKKLNFIQKPSIIISASGMAEAGRILHHLKNHITDPRCTVLIVGYQAENTLGRRIVDRVPEVRIFGQPYPLKAHVEVLNGFSGHADQNGLLEWIGHMSPKPRHTFLVHGEEKPANTLAELMKTQQGLNVTVPEFRQEVEV